MLSSLLALGLVAMADATMCSDYPILRIPRSDVLLPPGFEVIVDDERSEEPGVLTIWDEAGVVVPLLEDGVTTRVPDDLTEGIYTFEWGYGDTEPRVGTFTLVTSSELVPPESSNVRLDVHRHWRTSGTCGIGHHAGDVTVAVTFDSVERGTGGWRYVLEAYSNDYADLLGRGERLVSEPPSPNQGDIVAVHVPKDDVRTGRICARVRWKDPTGVELPAEDLGCKATPVYAGCRHAPPMPAWWLIGLAMTALALRRSRSAAEPARSH